MDKNRKRILLELAISILDSFAESSLYQDYKDCDEWTDEDFCEMMDELERLAKQA